MNFDQEKLSHTSSYIPQPKILHLRNMSQNITSHFKSQQKDIFCQRNLHQVKDFK